MSSTYPEPLSPAEESSPVSLDAEPHLRGVVDRALSVLMALLPCNTETARHVLAQAACAVGVSLERVAQEAVALRAGAAPPSAAVEAALRAAMGRSLAIAHQATPVLLPVPHTLRRHLVRFRDLRGRVLAAPDDATLRARYEDAGYTLCVLLGHRTVHGALAAAEQLVATHRLDGPR